MNQPQKPESWVVYLMTLHKQPGGMNAVCEQSEWEEMERARPGYHTLIQAGIENEGEAERLARGTAGDPKTLCAGEAGRGGGPRWVGSRPRLPLCLFEAASRMVGVLGLANRTLDLMRLAISPLPFPVPRRHKCSAGQCRPAVPRATRRFFSGGPSGQEAVRR